MSLKLENIRAHFEAYRGTLNESEDMAVLHLLQENEELKKDKARLDWLNQNGRVAKFSDGWNAWPYQKTGVPHISRNDIREAIDMAATPNDKLSHRASTTKTYENEMD